MTWFGWFLLGWWLFGVIVSVATIGRDRKPTTPHVAVVHIVIAGLLMAAVLYVGTGRGL